MTPEEFLTEAELLAARTVAHADFIESEALARALDSARRRQIPPLAIAQELARGARRADRLRRHAVGTREACQEALRGYAAGLAR